MPFVGATNIDGDSKELLAKYDQVVALLGRRERPLPGLISHYCMETDAGIRVVNCYETEEQLRLDAVCPGCQAQYAFEKGAFVLM